MLSAPCWESLAPTLCLRRRPPPRLPLRVRHDEVLRAEKAEKAASALGVHRNGALHKLDSGLVELALLSFCKELLVLQELLEDVPHHQGHKLLLMLAGHLELHGGGDKTYFVQGSAGEGTGMDRLCEGHGGNA